MHYVFVEGSLNRELRNKNKFSILMKKKQFAFHLRKKDSSNDAFIETMLDGYREEIKMLD